MKNVVTRYFDWIIVIFTFSILVLTFNNKSYIAVFIFFGLTLFFYGYSFKKTLFYILLLVLPFEKSLRDWHIPVVTPGVEVWMRSYEVFFGITLKYLASLCLLLIILFHEHRNRRYKKEFDNSLLLAFLILSFLSTIFAERFGLALLGFFRLMYLGWLFLICKYFFKQKHNKTFFHKLVIVFLLFFGTIGSLQFILNRPLGLYLEDQLIASPFGILTNESKLLYRTTGLIGHPTFFGSFLSLLIPIGLGIIAQKLNTPKIKISFELIIAVIAISASSLAVFGTFSRSSWLSLGFVIPIIFIIFWKRKSRYLNKKKFTLILAGISLAISTSFSSLLLLRLKTLNFIWSLGSGKGRLELIHQAWKMIQQQPIFGIGLNHFTAVMAKQNLSPTSRGFLYPVHNTFLLFITELGIPAGFLFIFLISSVMFSSWKKLKNNWISIGIWLGTFTFLINAQFHTLFNQDPSLDMFMVLLAYLSVV